jgi:hypothetical protein
MKKIFTLLLFCSMLYTTVNSQTEVRLIAISDTRVATQFKIGPSVSPVPNVGTDICTPIDADTLFTDLSHALIWSDTDPIDNLVAVNTEFDPLGCFGGTNMPPCGCLINCELGNRHGLVVEAMGNVGGTEFRTFANIVNTCTVAGGWNVSAPWEVNVWYTVVEIDAIMAPAPPGSEPLALIDMLSLDDGSISGIAPNIGIAINNITTDYIPMINTDPLPLDLLSFDAKKEGDKSASLAWTTANEVNTKLFVIQRSGDRENWNDIGGVEAAVNSSGIKQYNFMDKNVFSGRANREVYYYRLKMVDQDDSFKYSNIDVVSFSAFLNDQDGVNIFMYPNPATDGVNVEISQSEDSEPITRLEMYDITGKMVFSRDILAGSEIEFINFADLSIASGTYVLRAVDAANVAQAHEKLVVLR